MNILLLGSSGRVGKAVTGIITGNGHQLTALTSDKNQIDLQSEHLEIVEGNIYDWMLLKQLSIRGFDVIINAIEPEALIHSSLVTDATIAITSLFNLVEKPVRFIGLTGLAQMDKTFFGRITIALSKLTPFKYALEDYQSAYEVTKTSDLDWCLIACPPIIDGAASGIFQYAGLFGGGQKQIHAGDVAIAICNELEQHNSKKVIGVWY
jgi:uncharacterized protein